MPLITSNNLDLVQVVPGQANQATTFNDKGGELDSFLTDSKQADVSGGNVTISAADYRRYNTLLVVGATVVGRTVTLQPIKRTIKIESDPGNTQSVSIVVGSTSLTLAAGKTGEYRTDGTTNGLKLQLTDDLVGSGTLPFEYGVAGSDETTPITTGTSKTTFRMPCNVTLTAVRASLTTAQSSGSTLQVDINKNGTSILSTKLTIDNTEKTSTSAAVPPVISTASLSDDDEITIDVDTIGDGTATGLKILLLGTRV